MRGRANWRTLFRRARRGFASLRHRLGRRLRRPAGLAPFAQATGTLPAPPATGVAAGAAATTTEISVATVAEIGVSAGLLVVLAEYGILLGGTMIWLAAFIGAVVVAIGSAIIYGKEIAPDLTDCAWDEADLRGPDDAPVARFVLSSGLVVEMARGEVATILGAPEDAPFPARLRIWICSFPELRFVVRGLKQL